MMAEANEASSPQPSAASLELAYYRALELADFKGGFLARTAHELRSPLSKVISLQQMIIEGLCDDVEEERAFVGEAYAASMKLLEYLDFLIRVSKVEMGRIIPQVQTVPWTQIFSQVKEMNQLQVTDRNLRLVVNFPEPSQLVQTDPAWLCNVLTTLIDMALANRDRGTLHLSLAPTPPAETWQLWLDDDRPTGSWQEPIAFPQPTEFELNDTLSASLRMGLVEAMLQALGGSLVQLTQATDTTPTRLQLTLPQPPNLGAAPA